MLMLSALSSYSAYAVLFFAAFLAATLLPAQSETVLVGLILTKQFVPWLLVAVATLGNTLGSVLNWWLGRSLQRFQHKRWFPVSEVALHKAQTRFQRYGYWSLLLSWLPIVGDPLTMIAGVLRVPLLPFVLLVGVAKLARYALLAWLAT
ncbi:MAG: hypothetical protein RI964_2071 [Pseudomonadota bacterium]